MIMILAFISAQTSKSYDITCFVAFCVGKLLATSCVCAIEMTNVKCASSPPQSE